MNGTRYTDTPQSVPAYKNRIRLTNPRIAALEQPKGSEQIFLWDEDTRQLGVRTTKGSKSFIFQSRLKNGSSIRITIGKVSNWNIEDARIKAREFQGLIDSGRDPREVITDAIQADQKKRLDREKQKAKEINQEVIFKTVWDRYIEARSSDDGERKAWGERTIKDHLDIASEGGAKRKRASGVTVSGSLFPLMKMRLVDVSQEVVESLMKRENQQRPTRAALAFRLLRAFIRWAYDQPQYKDFIVIDSVAPSTARRAVRKVKPKENDCLQREQLSAWFDSVKKLANPVQSAYLQGLLITGARRNELMGLKWADVDFKWKTLTIRDKVEGERVIPLTPYFANQIKYLPKVNQWVFSANSKDGRISEPRSAHVRALEMAGLPHISIHGLRRSFGTLAEWCEAPVGVVAQIMGHKPSAIAEKHYRRRPIDLLRMWHSKIEAWILEEAGINQPEQDAPILKVVSAKGSTK